MDQPEPVPDKSGAPLEVFRVALRLGCTSFGGPIAHLGYFREEYVHARGWVDEATYADLVALCQFLPGPASSQVGIAIGTLRAGKLGGVLGWIGFTAPSAILMTLFAFSLDWFDIANAGWVDGLKIVAVAIVAQAVWGMGKQFCTDVIRIVIAVLATVLCLIANTSFVQVGVIVAAGIVGWLALRGIQIPTSTGTSVSPITRHQAYRFLCIFALLLVTLPFLNAATDNGVIEVVDTFYRAGSLVFGGGHSVLPLLEQDVVGGAWLSAEQFLAGYGAVQAMPGPLFTFSAYLGSERNQPPNGVAGALIATVAVFLPSLLLVFGTLPFWQSLRTDPRFRSALAGINAAVVGILLAALYSPVWTGAIHSVSDFTIAALCVILLMILKRPSWQVVVFAAIAGQVAGSYL